jgi:two-component system sensor histidine kinase TctE
MRRLESFDLLHTVYEVVRDVVPRSWRADVRFISEMDHAPFVGDALMVEEALKNVIDNALKHGSSESDPILVDLQAQNGAYRITISDRGPGIPLAERERVFERFSRGDSRAAGAGLGLAIVRRAVRSHGGDVVLGDRLGGGLHVTLLLPFDAPGPTP